MFTPKRKKQKTKKHQAFRKKLDTRDTSRLLSVTNAPYCSYKIKKKKQERSVHFLITNTHHSAFHTSVTWSWTQNILMRFSLLVMTNEYEKVNHADERLFTLFRRSACNNRHTRTQWVTNKMLECLFLPVHEYQFVGCCPCLQTSSCSCPATAESRRREGKRRDEN